MKAELMATIEGGVLKPDMVLPFPDHTRVKLTIEPVKLQNAEYVRGRVGAVAAADG